MLPTATEIVTAGPFSGRESVPEAYSQASPEKHIRAIAEAKATLRDRLLILGHHYQRDEVIQFADYTGDSLKLSRLAAENRRAEFLVFCGVHFMAEVADMLTAPDQKVILPHEGAGCPLADMATMPEVRHCYHNLKRLLPEPPLPVTYINSDAELKAFCGRHGGAICTSANAVQVISWGLQRAARVLFFPDQHLGRYSGAKLGLSEAQMPVWDSKTDPGPDAAERFSAAPLILWRGFCQVHTRFTPEQVAAVRARYPGIKVIVHPECPRAVVEAADQSGSTEGILRAVSQSPPGSAWAVGTEQNLVARLAAQHPDKTVVPLMQGGSVCPTMALIDLAHLHWVLDNLLAGRVVNQVRVPPEVAEQARVALNRMLELA